MSELRYPLSSPGIFRTVQGEGVLLGVPMAFVRLGGCSVGCEGCDTNYAVGDRKTAVEIALAVRGLTPRSAWTWITGGEPADHQLFPLLDLLKCEARIALVTSGRKSLGAAARIIDFLSVSPHGMPDELHVRNGNQVNLVPNLGGTNLTSWADFDFSGFEHKWVTPKFGDADSFEQCQKWLRSYRGWRLGVQAHKTWGLP